VVSNWNWSVYVYLGLHRQHFCASLSRKQKVQMTSLQVQMTSLAHFDGLECVCLSWLTPTTLLCKSVAQTKSADDIAGSLWWLGVCMCIFFCVYTGLSKCEARSNFKLRGSVQKRNSSFLYIISFVNNYVLQWYKYRMTITRLCECRSSINDTTLTLTRGAQNCEAHSICHIWYYANPVFEWRLWSTRRNQR